MSARVGISGFGLIGRNVFRAARGSQADVEIVAVNRITDAETLAHVLKFDSGLRACDRERGRPRGHHRDRRARAEGARQRDPAALPCGDLDVDVVIESAGLFTKREDAAKHLEAGAEKAIISAPATEPDVTVVLGVNFDDAYDPENHGVISNASCTTGCLAPVAKVLHDAIGIGAA